MSNLETISGRIIHVGSYTRDEHCHTYSLIEVETANGRRDLKTVMAANELDRAIAPGRSVSMSIFRSGQGTKEKSVVLGIHDAEAQRTFVNEEMFKLREHATKQTIWLSLTAIVWLPFAFLLFVAPGFIGLWVLWKSWSSIKDLPTADEIRASVQSLAMPDVAHRTMRPKVGVRPQAA